MRTKQRLSFSLPISQVMFIKKYSQRTKKTQSAVLEEAIIVLKKIQEINELKSSYIQESNVDDGFVDIALNCYNIDFLNNEN